VTVDPMKSIEFVAYLLQDSTVSTLASVHSNNQQRKSRGNKRKSSKAIIKPIKTLYRFNCFISEEVNKQIFAVQFNHFIERKIFAAAAGFRISIYECLEPKETEDEGIEEDDDDFSGIKLLRAYDDPDRDEVYYTLAWSYDANGPIIAAGGVRSVVRIIYVNGPGLREKKFIGHSKYERASLRNL